MRVGVEGFFCIIRNTPSYHMEPKWFFTSQALMDYMRIAVPVGKPWDFAYVAANLEAFAIAGCDPISESSPRLCVHAINLENQTFTEPLSKRLTK